MNATIFNQLKVTASAISKVSRQYGIYAQRKIDAVNADSDLETLIRVGEDLILLAKVAGVK